jgi:hypothetical protein
VFVHHDHDSAAFDLGFKTLHLRIIWGIVNEVDD